MTTATTTRGRIDITPPDRAVERRATIARADATPPPRPALEAVRARAYEIYRARMAGGTEGDALTDWLRAESQLGATTRPASGIRPSPDPLEAHEKMRGETLLRSGD